MGLRGLGCSALLLLVGVRGAEAVEAPNLLELRLRVVERSHIAEAAEGCRRRCAGEGFVAQREASGVVVDAAVVRRRATMMWKSLKFFWRLRSSASPGPVTMMVAAGALVRLVGCQAARPVGVRWAAPRIRVGSERAGAGAEWSLHLCCIKGLHRRHARTPRNTARGPRHTGPAQEKHPPNTPHPPTQAISWR